MHVPSFIRQRILIVDDTPANIRILQEILGDKHEILFATSGREALDLIAQRPPDLILLDVMMPGMDGYEVCRKLKANPSTRNIPVIFITALDDEQDETRGLEVGGIDYITKPISPPIVRARVRNHLELKRYRDTLEHLSAIDGLTGVANRRRLDEWLEREWRRELRNGAPLSVCLMDVDFFKRFNDRYGHAAGDECLRKIAATLSGMVQRPTDLIARYGGEEFVAVLPETDAAHATMLAEKFRTRVEGLGIPHADSPVADHVTISGGVATTLPSEHAGPADLLKAADGCLYEAKKTGRNRIVAMQKETLTPPDPHAACPQQPD